MFQSSPMDIGKQKEGEQTVLVEIESIQFLLRVNPFKGHYIVAIAQLRFKKLEDVRHYTCNQRN